MHYWQKYKIFNANFMESNQYTQKGTLIKFALNKLFWHKKGKMIYNFIANENFLFGIAVCAF